MSRVKRTEVELTLDPSSQIFVGYELCIHRHTAICSKGTATTGTVEIRGTIGDSASQKINQFTISSLAPIHFEGSYDSIDFIPVGVDGDGYAISMVSTD